MDATTAILWCVQNKCSIYVDIMHQLHQFVLSLHDPLTSLEEMKASTIRMKLTAWLPIGMKIGNLSAL
jgi:hypothetical protein